MSQFCLADFDKKDDFNLFFESEFIKSVDFESEIKEVAIYEYKQTIKTARKPKKKKLVYIVLTDHEIKGQGNFGFFEGEEFTKKEDAIKWFNDQKEELQFLKEKSDNNILFDNRRYFWKVEGDKIIERC